MQILKVGDKVRYKYSGKRTSMMHGIGWRHDGVMVEILNVNHSRDPITGFIRMTYTCSFPNTGMYYVDPFELLHNEHDDWMRVLKGE